MYYYDILSPDPSFDKNQEKFMTPNYNFDLVNDFKDMRPRDGRTISNVNGFYSEYISHLFDYEAQYPCIMIGYNICFSTMVSNDFIKENNLREKIDYETFVVPNVKTNVVHNCPTDSKTC